VATPITSSVRLTGADGGPLRVDVRRARDARAAIVMCHGFKGFKDWGFFPVTAARLARAGYAVVSFNFSGSGVGEDGLSFSEPQRFAHATYSHHLEDLDLVLKALADGRLGFQLSSVALLGHSMGGGVAILRAAADRAVAALVTWAATGRFGRLWRPEQVPEWRRTGTLDIPNQRTGEILPLSTDMLDDWERNRSALDPTAAAPRVTAPWLIAHGSADESVPATDAVQLAERAPNARLLVIEGASHTFGIGHPWSGSTPAFDQLLEETAEWFTRHVPA
jgi:pimeloyl-ACP methyl ester carboxylesterase